MRTLTLAGAALALAMTQASAQTKWNLPSAYPLDNPHVENLNAFAKDVAEATGGKREKEHAPLEDHGRLRGGPLPVLAVQVRVRVRPHRPHRHRLDRPPPPTAES